MAGKDKYGQVPPVPLFPGEVPGSPVMPVVPGQSPLVLLNAQQKVEGRIRWALNNISLELPPVPYAHGIGVSPSVGPNQKTSRAQYCTAFYCTRLYCWRGTVATYVPMQRRKEWIHAIPQAPRDGVRYNQTLFLVCVLVAESLIQLPVPS